VIEHLPSLELARRRAFDPTYPTFLGVDDKLQRLLKWSYEILRIESPVDKEAIWDVILQESGIRTIELFPSLEYRATPPEGFVLAVNPSHARYHNNRVEFLLVPEEIALKMKALECPLTKT
jgi:hypothetical protein